MTPLAAAATSPSGVTTGALLALAGVLVAAFITQWWTHRREREARRAEAQRVALYEFQDAAFELRQAYERYTATYPPTEKATRRHDKAVSWIDVVRVRVFDDGPKLRYRDWVKWADARFLDGEHFSEEDKAWQDFHRAIGAALKKWR